MQSAVNSEHARNHRDQGVYCSSQTCLSGFLPVFMALLQYRIAAKIKWQGRPIKFDKQQRSSGAALPYEF
jgi:hypothetical protein